MMDIMKREASSSDLKDLVAKFIPEGIGKQIEKACQGVYPLQNVFVLCSDRTGWSCRATNWGLIVVVFYAVTSAGAAAGASTLAPVSSDDAPPWSSMSLYGSNFGVLRTLTFRTNTFCSG